MGQLSNNTIMRFFGGEDDFSINYHDNGLFSDFTVDTTG
jgi:hypothetical protein